MDLDDREWIKSMRRYSLVLLCSCVYSSIGMTGECYLKFVAEKEAYLEDGGQYSCKG
jgi:hypothetical protein